MEGVLRERSEASDKKSTVNGYADFFYKQVPGFIVNATRIFWAQHDFVPAGFSICKNGLLQNKKSLPDSITYHIFLFGKNNNHDFPIFQGAVTYA